MRFFWIIALLGMIHLTGCISVDNTSGVAVVDTSEAKPAEGQFLEMVLAEEVSNALFSEHHQFNVKRAALVSKPQSRVPTALRAGETSRNSLTLCGENDQVLQAYRLEFPREDPGFDHWDKSMRPTSGAELFGMGRQEMMLSLPFPLQAKTLLLKYEGHTTRLELRFPHHSP
jgi:hypothetical protein